MRRTEIKRVDQLLTHVNMAKQCEKRSYSLKFGVSFFGVGKMCETNDELLILSQPHHEPALQPKFAIGSSTFSISAPFLCWWGEMRKIQPFNYVYRAIFKPSIGENCTDFAPLILSNTIRFSSCNVHTNLSLGSFFSSENSFEKVLSRHGHQSCVCWCVLNCKKNSKRRNVVSIDSCLNNVTQNDAWCFSNRLAGYNRTVAVIHSANTNRQSIPRRIHILRFIHRVSFDDSYSTNVAIVHNRLHCTKNSKDWRYATNISVATRKKNIH